jgi:DNA-directed RNA polymerase specialized sigma24 family protein
LRRRLPPDDALDLVQNVLAVLLESAERPETPAGLLALARRILHDKLVDYYRHREVVARVESPRASEGGDDAAGPLPPADAWDPLDAFKRRRLVESMVARGEISAADVELLERSAHEGFADAARERRTTTGALRLHAHRKRALLRNRWARYAAYGAPALLLLVLILHLLLRHDTGAGAHSKGSIGQHAPAAP